MSTELIQIVYASAARKPFSQFALTRLLIKARRSNAATDISGVLLYFQESFFQILEGPVDVVEPLYAKIVEDPRHSRILLIARLSITERNFRQWHMGFVNLGSTLEELPGFLRILDTHSSIVDSFGYKRILSRTGEKVVPALHSASIAEVNLPKLHGPHGLVVRLIEGFEKGRWRQSADD